jgi:hypothetical protein
MNAKENHQKNANQWILNNKLLNNQWVTEEIGKEIM